MIDFNFIVNLEGCELNGYVSDAENSQSGVTIASGFDLGSRGWGDIPDTLKPILSKYCGLRGQSALNYLKRNPLTITTMQAKILNEYAHKEALNRLLDAWYSDVDFESLSIEIRTVIASVAFQYGSLAVKCPNFWKQVNESDWLGALANLRNFGDRYPTRRNKEADLLESRLNQY